MKPSIVLVGGGGHCKACIDVVEQEGAYNIAGIVDTQDRVGSRVWEYDIFATDEDIPELARKYTHFLLSLGQIKDPGKRAGIYEKIKKCGGHLPVVVSPLAHVSRRSFIGEGTIVMHHAMIGADARIGNNCIINTKTLIEHDVRIGDHCHIATGAILNGGVIVGARTFIGSHSVIRESVKIGENVLIGFGSMIGEDVPSGSLVK